MKKCKKFFFTKEDNVIERIEKIERKQMLKIVGGNIAAYKCATCQYTESTYVRS
jgi:hypothetical protein